MAGVKAKGGRKNRKHGRWSRAPSMKAYKATGRLEINKAKRKARHLKRVARQRAKAAARAA